MKNEIRQILILEFIVLKKIVLITATHQIMKLTFQLFTVLLSLTAIAQPAKPFRIGIAGLTHTHVHEILSRAHDVDIEIVGIAEPNGELAERFLKQHNLPMSLVYASLTEMLDKTKPEAVTAFNSIEEHLEVVRLRAPRKIHVMGEKPLAVSLAHAKEMQALATQHGIQLLTRRLYLRIATLHHLPTICWWWKFWRQQNNLPVKEAD